MKYCPIWWSVFDRPLEVSLRPSTWLARYVLTAYVAAATTVLMAPLHFAPKVLLFAAVVGGLAASLTRYASGPAHITLGRNGEVSVRDALMGPPACYRLVRVWAHPWLVIIGIRHVEGGYRRIVIPADSTDPESFRRLRVILMC